jgi:hypothetical protein
MSLNCASVRPNNLGKTVGFWETFPYLKLIRDLFFWDFVLTCSQIATTLSTHELTFAIGLIIFVTS